uniref:Uncharacterized protein n=1 Tax=Strongyloides venezuelensis TaxID=75913 RepID=A0A0K0FG81_STRVS
MQLKYLLFLIAISFLSKYIRGDLQCAKKFTITGKEFNKAITFGISLPISKCDHKCITTSLSIFNGGNSLKAEAKGCFSKEKKAELKGKLECGMQKDLRKDLKKTNIKETLPQDEKNTSDLGYWEKELNVSLSAFKQDEKQRIQRLIDEAFNKNVNFDELYKKHEAGGTFSTVCCNKDYCNMSVITKYSIGTVIGDRHCVQKLGLTDAGNDGSVNFELYDSNVVCFKKPCMTLFFKIYYHDDSFNVDYRDCLPEENYENLDLVTCGKNIDIKELIDRIERDADKYFKNITKSEVDKRLNEQVNITLDSYDEATNKLVKTKLEDGTKNISKIARKEIGENGLGGKYTIKCCDKNYCNMSKTTKYSIGLVIPAIFLSLFLMIR